MFILSKALQKTGILEYLIIKVKRLADKSILLGRTFYLLTIGLMSAVINNTAIVSIFMPVTIRLAHKYKMSPSKMLIPLSYAAILGGTLTLVGTSTNLLVNTIFIATSDYSPLGMFEFMKYGIILLITGLLYILFIAPKLLPSRTVTSSLTKSYHLGGYLTEMKIRTESPLVGQTCMDRGINRNYDVMVLDILRDGKMITDMIRLTTLREGDVLFVRGTLDNFLIKKWIEKSDRQYIIFGSKDDVKKANQLINYINQRTECRNINLLSYFGENKVDNCKNCDNCNMGLRIKNNSEKTVENAIFFLLI